MVYFETQRNNTSIVLYLLLSHVSNNFSIKLSKMDWTREEVYLIVRDYFDMLQKELQHKKYNKTAHRRLILEALKNRSRGSIEFKHQNISAILIKTGIPFIKGYKPLYNYQQLLEDEVLSYLKNHKHSIEDSCLKFSDEQASSNHLEKINFDVLLDSTAPDSSSIGEPEPKYTPIKTNFLEREQNNRSIGELGEQIVVEFEKWRLKKEGKKSLADKVLWVSKDLGDGAGYDILSKNNNGTDRFIEVKSTKLSKETPIYLSRNELRFAKTKGESFFLYRVFNVVEKPKMFIKQGEYESICALLQPQSFKGFF